jgi:hypothetical protein
MWGDLLRGRVTLDGAWVTSAARMLAQLTPFLKLSPIVTAFSQMGRKQIRENSLYCAECWGASLVGRSKQGYLRVIVCAASQ